VNVQFVGWSLRLLGGAVSHHHHDSAIADERSADGGLSRARLLRTTAGSALLGSRPRCSTLPPGRATPKKGGALRGGVRRRGKAETLNPFLAVTPIDQCPRPEPVRPARHHEPDLAQSGLGSLEPQQELTGLRGQAPQASISTRKTLGAGRIYSSADGEQGKRALPFVSGIRLGELKAIDKNTVRISLKAPDAESRRQLRLLQHVDSSAGLKDYKHPSAPGRSSSSRLPRQQSVYVAQELLVTGKPTSTRQDRPISDNTARLNALLSGRSTRWRSCDRAREGHAATGDMTVRSPRRPAHDVLTCTTKAPYRPAGHARDEAIASQGASSRPSTATHGRQRHRRQGAAFYTARCRSASRTSRS